MLQIDIEDAFEQPGPAQASEGGGMRCLGLIRGSRVRLGGGARDNRGTQLSVGCEHAMEADEMQPRTGDERGEALHKLQGLHYDMRGPVVVGAFEGEHDLPRAVECQPLIGNGGPGDIPTEVFQLITLIDGEPHLGMQAKSSSANNIYK